LIDRPVAFLEHIPARHPAGHFNQKENNKMQVQTVTVAQFADLLEQSRIIEASDHGATVTHRAEHPELGQIVMVSGITEPWLIVRGPINHGGVIDEGV
jgi:predicted transcriptional regulator